MRKFNMQPVLDKTESSIIKAMTKLEDEEISLAIVSIGDNPASEVYMRAKVMACRKFNIDCVHARYTDKGDFTGDTFFEFMVYELERLEKAHTGVILQLPIESDKLSTEQKNKLSEMVGRFGGDVDAFGPDNLASVMTNRTPEMLPCTVQGVKDILKEYVMAEMPTKYSERNNSYAGLKVAVIGRSKIVGMPLINNLIMQDADVVALHSKNMSTDVLDPRWKDVDVIVLATGHYGVIDTKFLNLLTTINNKKIFVIDVGINRIDGKLHGDLKINSDENDRITYTPVPGGVGKTTVLNLMKNLTILANKK